MFELVLMAPESRIEDLGDALEALDALSVSVEDADAATDAEQALFGEPGMPAPKGGWNRSRVVALFQQEQQAREAAELLPPQDFFVGCEVIGVRPVADQDWVRLTQSQFGPIHIAERLWIVPSWHRDNPDVPAFEPEAATQEGAIHIELDPGLAFGTGSHPTTHLCLAWLEAELPAGATLLDYGCGSGILAIAARKLGAGPTQAVDIDAQAVQSTVFNAEVNHVELQAMLPDALAEGTFEVVVANILSNPLKVLAPMLAGRVAAGGHLVLSGVLERQAEEVAAAYAPWIAMSVWRARDGWVCLHGQKA